MLSLEQRLALLASKLEKVTADELYLELQSYEPSGPLAKDFLRGSYFFSKSDGFFEGELDVWSVVYMHELPQFPPCNDEDYTVCLAA